MPLVSVGVGDIGATLVSGYPTYADLQAFALAAGVVASSDNHLDYRRVIASAIAQWESDTNCKPYAATTQTRTYDVPSGKVLDLGTALLSLTSLTIDGNVYTEGTDFALLPRNAERKGAVFFSYPFSGHDNGLSTITIAGTWGYASSIPADVVQAVLALGAVLLVPTKGANVGAATTIKQDDVELQFSSISAAAAHYTAQQNQFLDLYRSTVARYKRWVIV